MILFKFGKFRIGKDLFKYGIMSFLLMLDSFVYMICSWLYSLFVGLSRVEILTDDAYQAIADRIYILVGVVALFVMTFTLLQSMVDPDKAGQNVIKSFKSLITSILLVILLPTIFSYAFSFQNAIIADGVIHNLLNVNIDSSKAKKKTPRMDEVCGMKTANYNIYDGNGKIDVDLNSGNSNKIIDKVRDSSCEGNYIILSLFEAFFQTDNDNVENEYKTTWHDAKLYIAHTGDFGYIRSFTANVSDTTDFTYIFLISTVAGFFFAYVVLSFCIDLGVRAFKLAFYQIIAPIPIFLRILPGKDNYFSKWMSATLKCFLEIFIRILLMEFMIFMCKNFLSIMETAFDGMEQVALLGKAVLILGLCGFIKQAPKLFTDALGIEGTGVKLNVKEKIHENAPLREAAALGASATAGMRAFTSGASGVWSNIKNTHAKAKNAQGLDKAKILGMGALSTGWKALGTGVGTIGSSLGGMKAGYDAGKDAKSFEDMKNAAGAGAKKIGDKRAANAKHRAMYGGPIGVAKNNILDAVAGAKKWAGGSSIVDQVKFEEEWVKAFDSYKASYENAEYQSVTSRLNELKALAAQGMTRDRDGNDVQAGIANLKAKQKALREEAIKNNNDAARMTLLNLSTMLQTNPGMASKLNLTEYFSPEEAKKISIQNNKVMYDGNILDQDTMIRLLENSHKVIDENGNESIDGGIFGSRKAMADQKRNDSTSIAYQEYQRKQEESKNNK